MIYQSLSKSNIHFEQRNDNNENDVTIVEIDMNQPSILSSLSSVKQTIIMASSSADVAREIGSSSSEDEHDTSSFSFSNVSNASTASSYTSKQVEQLLSTQKRKFRILRNERASKTASWWHCFGYPAVLNENDKFERIAGFVSCFKCCHTLAYGPNSGTKRFIDHAKRCSPSTSSPLAIGDGNSSHPAQAALDMMVVKKRSSVTAKEQNDLKELYANWICEDVRPFSIVEDKGFQQLAQMFIRIGKNIFSCPHLNDRSIGRSIDCLFLLGAQRGLIDVEEVLRSR